MSISVLKSVHTDSDLVFRQPVILYYRFLWACIFIVFSFVFLFFLFDFGVHSGADGAFLWRIHEKSKSFETYN